jgi:hypothetical protein
MRWKLFFNKNGITIWQMIFFSDDKMHIGAKQLVFITKYDMDLTANKVIWIKKKCQVKSCVIALLVKFILSNYHVENLVFF